MLSTYKWWQKPFLLSFLGFTSFKGDNHDVEVTSADAVVVDVMVDCYLVDVNDIQELVSSFSLIRSCDCSPWNIEGILVSSRNLTIVLNCY